MRYPVGSIGVVAIHTQCPYKTLICGDYGYSQDPSWYSQV